VATSKGKGKKGGKPAAKAAPAKKAAKKAPVKSAKKAAPKAKKAAAAKPAAKKAEAAKKPEMKKAEAKKAAPMPPKKPALPAPKNSSSKQYSQSELYECLKGYCGFMSRSEAKNFYGDFVNLIQGALKSGYKVVLPGLGKIQVRKTKPRKGINPATREPINIPARRKVSFTAMKALKEAVL
jgi:DNA-binding protein HU-beta